MVEQTIIAELNKRRPYGFTDPVTRDTDLGDLRLDVLDEVEVIFAIEEALPAEIVSEWPRTIVTAGDLIDWMERQVEAKAA